MPDFQCTAAASVPRFRHVLTILITIRRKPGIPLASILIKSAKWLPMKYSPQYLLATNPIYNFQFLALKRASRLESASSRDGQNLRGIMTAFWISDVNAVFFFIVLFQIKFYSGGCSVCSSNCWFRDSEGPFEMSGSLLPWKWYDMLWIIISTNGDLC